MPDAADHPLSEGEAYREHLLRQLGGDDPAEVQAETPRALRALVEGVPPEIMTFRPEGREYSLVEILGHMADGEMVVSTRYRWVLSEDLPELAGYDQDRWVSTMGHQAGDPVAFLAVFEALRTANLELWRQSPGKRQRAGTHLERGEESYDLMFRMIAGHDRVHLAQARATLAAARAALPFSPPRRPAEGR